MGPAPPTSVLLPTVRWTDAIPEIAAQLGADDELLVVADDDGDSIAGRHDDLPDPARLVFAGEPEGCSGKANAIAAGMTAASNDRIVWTDDDFHHPPDWLATLQADYEQHGPVSEVPFFVGRDPLAWLLEPVYAVGGNLAVSLGDKAWAGAVVFEREDLRDEAAFLADLQRTISDDGLLTEYLDLTTLRRTRIVEIGGNLRDTLERHARFTQIAYRFDPVGTTANTIALVPVAIAALLFPVAGFLLATALAGLLYWYVGVRRWTVLLGYPSVVAGPVLMAYGLTRRSFRWGGRRYRWRSKFDVRVLE